VLRPAAGGLTSSLALDRSHILFGCDATPGIVSVDADNAGRARVWRHEGGQTRAHEYRFPNWFLATSLDLLAHLSARRLESAALRTAHGQLNAPDSLTVVELDEPHASDDDGADLYRYLVLTTHLSEVETALVEMSNKRDGGEAQTLEDLRGLVLVLPPIEQFLILTGRTYFKGMSFADLRRLQFDLETTGLNEDRDRIFMISLRDSSGWRASLDTSEMTETQLIEHFVELVSGRDPDVLENHNIFAFDLPFLVKRAARLGVRLALGRDGSEPWVETDIFDTGERGEPFLRWRVAGREVVDTQHAVRRFGFAAPDMRRHGLKDAARYFGFAREDREYVPGAEVWPTFRTDPERIRRYAADDVDEVDGLSRRLLPAAFGLANMLPRAYERIAADCGPASLWEPLLLRAYLHDARAIAAPMHRVQQPVVETSSELFLTGVVGASAQLTLRPLLPCIVVENGIAAVNDSLGSMPRLTAQLLRAADDEAALVLATAGPSYLAGQGLFSDPHAATELHVLARRYIDRLLDDLRTRGCVIVEVDGEQVWIALPGTWNQSVAQDVAQASASYLPEGVHLTYEGHYDALYARGPRSAIMLGSDGSVTLVGSTFRPGRLERYGEAFMIAAAQCVLRGDAVALRQVFLETVHRLRTAQIAVEDLCVQVTLHKSPAQYRRGSTREEPYEVLLAAGVRSWRVGQRIRYFRGRGGEARLLQEGEPVTAADQDTEYYVQRLASAYCQQFARAFRRDDFARIFRLPAGPGPFDEPDLQTELAGVRPIVERVGA
jgi:DNA polymerase, archaea type